MQFSAGDVVYLVSYPSHRMTVVEVDGQEIICRWFEGAAVKEGIFPAHLIAKVLQPQTTIAPAEGLSPAIGKTGQAGAWP